MRVNIVQENDFYRQCLMDKNLGKPARSYLKNRGIDKNTALYWHLGYSPLNVICDVFDENDTYRVWEKMQGRITIPIYNQNGDLISISGRAINPMRKPKYDHYPFPSRSTLFGLHQNKMDIFNEDKCFLTEGQFDVITAWQSGVKNVVSSFGSHCSLNQLSLIARYTNNIYILYDNDFAGYNGAKNINNYKIYSDLNLVIKNILPQGYDLDNYFKEYTKEEFYELLNKTSKENLLAQKLQYMKQTIKNI